MSSTSFNNKNILATSHVSLFVTGQFYTWPNGNGMRKGGHSGVYGDNGVTWPAGSGDAAARAPFVSGQLLMNVPIMFIVPAEEFLGNACNSSFYKLTVMTIGYLWPAYWL